MVAPANELNFTSACCCAACTFCEVDPCLNGCVSDVECCCFASSVQCEPKYPKTCCVVMERCACLDVRCALPCDRSLVPCMIAVCGYYAWGKPVSAGKTKVGVK